MKLTKESANRLLATLKLSYAQMQPSDLRFLSDMADCGVLERFMDGGTFGALFTRYRITPAGRSALSDGDQT